MPVVAAIPVLNPRFRVVDSKRGVTGLYLELGRCRQAIRALSDWLGAGEKRFSIGQESKCPIVLLMLAPLITSHPVVPSAGELEDGAILKGSEVLPGLSGCAIHAKRDESYKADGPEWSLCKGRESSPSPYICLWFLSHEDCYICMSETR